MTKSELIAALQQFNDDEVIVCSDEAGGWDNICEVKRFLDGTPTIVFGGGSPFSDGG